MPRKRRSAAPATKKTMYHYDGDRCAAFDCLKPTSNKVSWVGICLLVCTDKVLELESES